MSEAALLNPALYAIGFGIGGSMLIGSVVASIVGTVRKAA